MRGHTDEVEDIRFDGAGFCRPGPGVIEAIEASDALIIGPSNPILSIWPILAVPAIGEAVARKSRVMAVSPLIGGSALKGPAHRILAALAMAPAPRRSSPPMGVSSPTSSSTAPTPMTPAGSEDPGFTSPTRGCPTWPPPPGSPRCIVDAVGKRRIAVGRSRSSRCPGLPEVEPGDDLAGSAGERPVPPAALGTATSWWSPTKSSPRRKGAMAPAATDEDYRKVGCLRSQPRSFAAGVTW